MNTLDVYTLLRIFLLIPESIHEIAKASEHFHKIINGNELGKFLLDNPWETICQSAIKYKRIDFLKYLFAHGWKIDDELILYATKGKDIGCLRYICENVDEIEPDVVFDMIVGSANSGDPECFEYIYTKYRIMSVCAVSCRPVIESGSLECVKIAVKLHMPQTISPYACECAAEFGHLHILKYLHENGCGWDAGTTRMALKYRHWDCLRYALLNGCQIIYPEDKHLIKVVLGISICNGVIAYYLGTPMMNVMNYYAGFELIPLIKTQYLNSINAYIGYNLLPLIK